MEDFLKEIEDKIDEPISVGADHVHLAGIQDMHIIGMDDFSQNRIVLDVTYKTQKGAA